jgi:hypothetical protein
MGDKAVPASLPVAGEPLNVTKQASKPIPRVKRPYDNYERKVYDPGS